MPVSDDQTPPEDMIRGIGRMMAAMERLSADRGNMPFSLGLLFLAVSIKPGLQVKEYAQMVNLMPSHASRHLATLGPKERNGDEGLGLIETLAAAANERDTRVKRVVLTPKGTELRERIYGALNPQTSKEVH